MSHSHLTTLHRTRVEHLYNQLASGFLVAFLVLATEAFRPAGITSLSGLNTLTSLSGLNTLLHKMLHFAFPVVSLAYHQILFLYVLASVIGKMKEVNRVFWQRMGILALNTIKPFYLGNSIIQP